MTQKTLVRTIKVSTLEDLVLTDKSITKAGFKTHLRLGLIKGYIIEVYAVTEKEIDW